MIEAGTPRTIRNLTSDHVSDLRGGLSGICRCDKTGLCSTTDCTDKYLATDLSELNKDLKISCSNTATDLSIFHTCTVHNMRNELPG